MPTGGRVLSDAHRALLHASGIADAVIAAREYWTATATDADTVKALGHPADTVKHGAALMLPVHDVFGSIAFTVARPDRPLLDTRGRPKKYQLPRGAALTLDVPPLARATLKDLDTPLLIVEGQKKGDAAVSAGAGCCVVLLGVWSWKKITALGVWDEVALKGRLVRIAFDSDLSRNEKVQLAMRRLRAFLQTRGAEVMIIPLEDQPDGRKTGLDDALAAGMTLEQLYGMATTELQPRRRDATDTRPDLNVTVLDRRVVIEAFGRIENTDAVYRTTEGLVRVENADGAMVVRPLRAPELRAVLDRTVRCVRLTAEALIPCLPPRDLAEIMAHDPSPLVRGLRGVVTAPTFTADGRLLEHPGYDPLSRLLLAASVEILAVPAEPTPAQVAKARTWWDEEALVDFPFGSDADRTAALAFALTPLVRELIDGPVPLFMVEAPVRGAGKGKLVATCLTPTMGPAGWTVAVLSREDEELRKALTAYLLERRGAIVFDNIAASVRSAVLSKALTDRVWDDRTLGRSESVRALVRCTWAATGNNPSYSDEIARRIVPIRLIPSVDRPELLTDFRHPELESWVNAHRGELLWALCVFVRAWQAAGSPAPAVRPLGSYEAWSRVVGGILEAAGYADFLGNRESILAAGDPETGMWEAFVPAWWEAYQANRVRASTLLPFAEEYLQINGENERARSASLGKALGLRRDRFFGEFQIKNGQGRARNDWYLHRPVRGSETCERSDPTNLRVARTRGHARGAEHAGKDVSHLSRPLTNPEARQARGWDVAREAEEQIERAAIVGEGPA